jgi:hypothetical protein
MAQGELHPWRSSVWAAGMGVRQRHAVPRGVTMGGRKRAGDGGSMQFAPHENAQLTDLTRMLWNLAAGRV